MTIRLDLTGLDLTNEERAIVSRIVSTRGRTEGCLKEAAPKHRFKKEPTGGDILDGKAYYVWRNLVFIVGEKSAHHCMPVTADFALCGSYDERQIEAKRLDALVDRITATIPKSQWHGITRWARALGG